MELDSQDARRLVKRMPTQTNNVSNNRLIKSREIVKKTVFFNQN